MHNKPHTEEAKLKMSLAHKGQHASPATEFKKGCKPFLNKKIPKGEKHYKWQEKPTYHAVHFWIRKELGFPNTCLHCGLKSDNHRKIQWANLSGEYKRDILDWIRLCSSCHKKYDMKRNGNR